MLSRAQASRRCDLLAPASFTDFAGWSMPVRYSSEIAEHTAVRPRKALVSELPSVFRSWPPCSRYYAES